MINVITPVLRDEKSKLNELLEQLIKDWESENEAVLDIINDMTLDHSERRDKSFWEVVANPENYQELVTLQARNITLESNIADLKRVIYSDYEETPIKMGVSKERAPHMNKEASMEWIGSKVKPRIIAGVTKKQIIADELCVDESTITVRLQRVFGKDMLWKTYVEKVLQGTL